MSTLGNLGDAELVHDPMDDVDDYEAQNDRFLEKTVSLMRECAVCAIYLDSDIDLKQASEIGAVLLLEKPFVLMVAPGAKVPEPLGRLARAIIFEFVPANHAKIYELGKIIHELEEEYGDHEH